MGTAIAIFSAAAIAAAAIAAAAEWYVRAAGKGPKLSAYKLFIRDPVLRFRGKPGLEIHIRNWTGEFACDYQHNGRGFRDREHPEKKPAATFRVICLGDSFTYGVGVEYEGSYPLLLEKMLNRRPGDHPAAEVFNMGLPGCFARQERIILESEGAALEPDLVLVGFLTNHVVDASMGMDTFDLTAEGYIVFREHQALGGAGNYLHHRLRLAQVILQKRLRKKRKQAFREAHPRDRDDLYREGGSFEQGWRRMEDQYRLMAKAAAELGAGLAIVNIPEMDFEKTAADYAEQRLARFCERESIRFLPTLAAFRRAAAGRKLYFPGDGHCTPEGYALVARTVFEELEKNRLVP